MEDEVILVNEKDVEVGKASKATVHKQGLLHRAFSIFIYNSRGEILLQQRALDKYHSPGLWTNACCSHPKPGETVEAAAKRRLKEELGIETPLKVIGSFIYEHKFENGLSENEFDYVLIGSFDEKPEPDPREVMALDYRTIDEINKDLSDKPGEFTVWFGQAFRIFNNWYKGVKS